MTYGIRTTSRVDVEISQIAAWYIERSGDQSIGDQWIAAFRSAAETLMRDPERCSEARESIAFDMQVHELLFGSGRKKTHRILFRILDEDQVVEVIGVRHKAQRDFTPDDM